MILNVSLDRHFFPVRPQYIEPRLSGGSILYLKNSLVHSKIKGTREPPYTNDANRPVIIV